MDWMIIVKSAIMLFAIVNPIGSIPVFLNLTNEMSKQERKRAFKIGVVSAAVILFVFIFTGERILTYFFQIEIADLMAAGGLLLLIIAIDHLLFGSMVKSVLDGENKDSQHIGAVPIACPILAGPGAMMTVLVIFSEHGLLVAVMSVIIVLGITWLIFQFIDVIYNFLGEIVCTVLSKILCLFIAAIGVHLLMVGLSYYFK